MMYRFALMVFKALAVVPFVQWIILRLFNTRFLVGVVGVIDDGEGGVLLFHHTYRKKYPWGLPGGWIKKGEHPEQALPREIREESGLTIESRGIFHLFSHDEGPSIEIVLLAQLTGGTFSPTAEVDKMTRVLPGEIPAGVKPAHAKLIDEYFRSKKELGAS